MQIQAGQGTGEGVAIENRILMPQIQVPIQVQTHQVLQVKINRKNTNSICMIPMKGALQRVLEKLKTRSYLKSKKRLTRLGI